MFNFVIFAVSLVLSVFLAEGVTRLVLDPMDYLAVSTTSDPVLNHRIPAGGSGHDDWGFRNSEVPDKADILAVGDSMTYGVMAKSFESWPAQLEDRTDQRVYNAALGGYGPLHYLHILKARAPDLQPEKAIVMLYAGNDLMDAYNLAYSNDAWAAYRRADNTETLDSSLFLPQEKKTRLTKRIRNWLAHHSVLYRLVTQSPLFDATRQREHLEASTSFGFQGNHDGSFEIPTCTD